MTEYFLIMDETECICTVELPEIMTSTRKREELRSLCNEYNTSTKGMKLIKNPARAA